MDHEPAAIEQIRSMAADEPDVDVIGEARDGHQAVGAILHLAPDLVFLDVQISRLNAFDIITAVGATHLPAVVFVSTCSRCALRAFEIGAFDYLLKPLDRTRFHRTLSRLRQQITNQRRGALGRTMLTLVRTMHSAGAAGSPQAGYVDKLADRVVVQSGDRLIFVMITDIDSVEAVSDGVRLHVDGESHLLRETMDAFEARLSPGTFVRIHRSYIVNIDRVTELRQAFNGEYAVVLHNGGALPLSRRYREALEKRLGKPLTALHRWGTQAPT